MNWPSHLTLNPHQMTSTLRRDLIFIVLCLCATLTLSAQLGCIETSKNDDNYDGIIDTYSESSSLFNAMGKRIATYTDTDFLNDGSIDRMTSDTVVYDDFDRPLSNTGRQAREGDGLMITTRLTTYDYPSENFVHTTTSLDFDQDGNMDFRIFEIYEYLNDEIIKTTRKEDTNNDGSFNNEEIFEFEYDNFGVRHAKLQTKDNDLDGIIDFSSVSTIISFSDKVTVHTDTDQNADGMVDDTTYSISLYDADLITSFNSVTDEGLDGSVDFGEIRTYTYQDGNNTTSNFTNLSNGVATSSTDIVNTFDEEGNWISRNTFNDWDADSQYDRSIERTLCLSEIPTIEVNVTAGDLLVNQENASVHLTSFNGTTFEIKANLDGSLSVNPSATPNASNIVEGGHIYFSAQNKLILRSDASTVVAIGVDDSGNVSTTAITGNTSNAAVLPDGNLSVTGANAGLLFKSPNGNCWKVFVDPGGSLATRSLPCPE